VVGLFLGADCRRAEIDGTKEGRLGRPSRFEAGVGERGEAAGAPVSCRLRNRCATAEEHRERFVDFAGDESAGPNDFGE
jgi:hypothetical protein